MTEIGVQLPEIGVQLRPKPVFNFARNRCSTSSEKPSGNSVDLYRWNGAEMTRRWPLAWVSRWASAEAVAPALAEIEFLHGWSAYHLRPGPVPRKRTRRSRGPVDLVEILVRGLVGNWARRHAQRCRPRRRARRSSAARPCPSASGVPSRAESCGCTAGPAGGCRRRRWRCCPLAGVGRGGSGQQPCRRGGARPAVDGSRSGPRRRPCSGSPARRVPAQRILNAGTSGGDPPPTTPCCTRPPPGRGWMRPITSGVRP